MRFYYINYTGNEKDPILLLMDFFLKKSFLVLPIIFEYICYISTDDSTIVLWKNGDQKYAQMQQPGAFFKLKHKVKKFLLRKNLFYFHARKEFIMFQDKGQVILFT